MQRIDTDDGTFTDGDASTGTKGTRVTAAWLYALQEEVAQAIEMLGVELDSENNAQLGGLLQGRVFELVDGVAVCTVDI